MARAVINAMNMASTVATMLNRTSCMRALCAIRSTDSVWAPASTVSIRPPSCVAASPAAKRNAAVTMT